MAKKQDFLLLAGGAVLGLGALVVGAYLVFGEQRTLTLSVAPSEVMEGSNIPLNATGNYTVNNQPTSATIYMRLRHPNGTYEPLNNVFGPQFSQTISSAGRAPGDYIVEASDRATYD